MADPVRWWDMRPAGGGQAKTYTCPICHGYLWAMNPNTLLFPEGDRQRRRHAHTDCVARQRKAGKLLTRAEWERTRRPPRSARRSWWRRLVGTRPPEQRDATSGRPDGDRGRLSRCLPLAEHTQDPRTERLRGI